jgi:hypothetical protein
MQSEDAAGPLPVDDPDSVFTVEGKRSGQTSRPFELRGDGCGNCGWFHAGLAAEDRSGDKSDD